jgi:uncharacterized surface protein with fasciclin (FAS1) repeats
MSVQYQEASMNQLHSIKTLEGASLPVQVSGSTVTVGGATVVKMTSRPLTG